MFFSGHTFTYNGISSELYGLFFANVDTVESAALGGDIEYNKFQLKRSGRFYRQDTVYNTPLIFEEAIVTNNPISQEKLHEINKWLFNQMNYKKLYVHDENYSYKDTYFNCLITSVERIEGCVGDKGYEIYGFKCKIECDAPWAWENEKVCTYTDFDINSYLIFNNTSDCNDYMYPKVQLTTGSGGNIGIQQITDNNRLTQLSHLSANETITMSVNPYNISSNINSNRYNDFNKKWLRFLVGKNKFSVIGDVTELKIIYSNARVV